MKRSSFSNGPESQSKSGSEPEGLVESSHPGGNKRPGAKNDIQSAMMQYFVTVWHVSKADLEHHRRRDCDEEENSPLCITVTSWEN